MNILGYLAIIALIVLGIWIVHDIIILYKIVQDERRQKLEQERSDNDADRESREDI